MLVPVLLVVGLMLFSVVGARVAELAMARVQLVPGLQSVSVTAGQTVQVTLPAGMQWLGGALISGTSYIQVAPVAGTGPVTFPAPPAMASFVANWGPPGCAAGPCMQGAVVLLVPPGQTGSSTVTDPASVAFATSTLAAVGQKGVIPTVTFGASGSTQTFAQGLAAFQVYTNGEMGPATGVQVRTDGVLDYATLALLASVASGMF